MFRLIDILWSLLFSTADCGCHQCMGGERFLKHIQNAVVPMYICSKYVLFCKRFWRATTSGEFAHCHGAVVVVVVFVFAMSVP